GSRATNVPVGYFGSECCPADGPVHQNASSTSESLHHASAAVWGGNLCPWLTGFRFLPYDFRVKIEWLVDVGLRYPPAPNHQPLRAATRREACTARHRYVCKSPDQFKHFLVRAFRFATYSTVRLAEAS